MLHPVSSWFVIHHFGLDVAGLRVNHEQEGVNALWDCGEQNCNDKSHNGHSAIDPENVDWNDCPDYIVKQALEHEFVKFHWNKGANLIKLVANNMSHLGEACPSPIWDCVCCVEPFEERHLSDHDVRVSFARLYGGFVCVADRPGHSQICIASIDVGVLMMTDVVLMVPGVGTAKIRSCVRGDFVNKLGGCERKVARRVENSQIQPPQKRNRYESQITAL